MPRVVILAVIIGMLWAGASPATAALESPGLVPADLAVIVNTSDPLSVAIGAYYARRRHIPKANVVHVQFDYQRDEIPVREFATLKAVIEAGITPHIQAYALTWARPYRVGCMSITSAFAFGVDTKYCSTGCTLTWPDPYFNSSSAKPYDDFHIRPTMMIGAVDFRHAQALIERGIRADRANPRGTAYLVETNDAARNTRAREYPQTEPIARPTVNVQILHDDAVRDRQDILFYFIGASSVPALDTNRFLPGAVADHLTSFGGMLTDSPQMSSLRWLEAGATGSYGTVVEPCSFPSKFPDVRMLMRHYVAGETLLESYWKSVLMPGQGVFIGEPLAAPFRNR